ncbi:MAG: sugar phosphate isomerase/epimerase [Anaerolineaceae bacterium]|nr:sugar phosphate isomerase/epimerase [Anaerolineaceae bacterium]
MRFGIMDMQLDMLLAGINPQEDFGAQIGGFDQTTLVKQLNHAGFNLVELSGDLTLFFPNSFSEETISHLAKLKKDSGISYSVHLPLWSVEPSTPLTAVRAGSVQAVVECINATQHLKPEMYVLHATGALAAEFYQMSLPDAVKSMILRLFQRCAAESIKEVLAKTGIEGRKLAIETIEFPFDMTLELADELDLSICLDIGHVLTGFSGPIELFEALEFCIPRLGEVHLHDAPWQGSERNIGYGKDHQTLGTGDLDVARMLKRLEDVNFSGPVIFELTLEEAFASLEYIERLQLDS